MASFAYSNHSNLSQQEKFIAQKAKRIFEYDKKNPKKMSFNQLAALSIAIQFEDYEGAKNLIYKLERNMN